MICNQQKYRVIGIMMLLVLMFSLIAPVSIYAVPEMPEAGIKTIRFVDSKITPDSVLLAMNENDKTLNSWDKGTAHYENGILYIDNKGEEVALLELKEGQVLVNPKGFEKVDTKVASKALHSFMMDGMAQVGANEDTVHEIMKDIQKVDNSVSALMLPIIFEKVEPDMFFAYEAMAPFLNLLSKGLAIGAVCLIIVLLFSTVMDLAYIGLPVWRESQEGKGNSKSHPFGVSYEAMLTVNDVEKNLGGGDGEYKNAYLLYFKRRALTYIILAICLMYLVCGGLSGIIGFVLSLASGITG